MPDARIIDAMHLGRPRVIGCWQFGDTLVDPGPESCIDTVLGEVDGPVRRVLLTHIHLDHAGATGAIVERMGDVEVVVHERGARHLVDPSKLLASAGRLYGDRMEELWGRVVPVPEERIRTVAGGETLEGGVEVAYAPGHASHHVIYRLGGTVFCGDVAGVRIAPAGFVLMPTPPPDIDLELWLESLAQVEAWQPERLALTHFGAVTGDVPRHLDIARARLREQAELARDEGPDGFAEQMTALLGQGAGSEAASYLQAAPPDQLYQGLRRYWDARAPGATR